MCFDNILTWRVDESDCVLDVRHEGRGLGEDGTAHHAHRRRPELDDLKHNALNNVNINIRMEKIITPNSKLSEAPSLSIAVKQANFSRWSEPFFLSAMV